MWRIDRIIRNWEHMFSVGSVSQSRLQRLLVDLISTRADFIMGYVSIKNSLTEYTGRKHVECAFSLFRKIIIYFFVNKSNVYAHTNLT